MDPGIRFTGRSDGGTNESLDWGTTRGLAFAWVTREESAARHVSIPSQGGFGMAACKLQEEEVFLQRCSISSLI